ncbi:MAG: hypothetical protein ACLQU1_19610 [Bryobacteraceae bacterium]
MPFRHSLRGALFLSLLTSAHAAAPFWIRIVDQETGRGVPLVRLSTPRDAIRFWTDSNGVAAIDDAALEGRDVIFTITSDGYEFPERILDQPATRVRVESGAHVELKIRRTNLAERLYRITGADIYRDSLLAGLPVPIAQPLLNGGVTGQDTNISTVYQGRLFWCYGDTFGLAAALFSVSCATSQLPGQGGLDPSIGIDLTYFVDAHGFSRAMLPLPRPGLVWIEGIFTVNDPTGRQRLVATYTRQPGVAPPTERGVAVFDDAAGQFRVLGQLPLRRGHKSSHPFQVTEEGVTYWYLFPHQRVRDEWGALTDPRRWESFTCLDPGATFDAANPRVEHGPDGALVWAWKPDTDRIEASEERRLIERGLLKKEEAWFALRDESGNPTGASPSSVVWNAWRKKWIMLAEKTGSVYYAEADRPIGPWNRAIQIVEHRAYNFYNVVEHPFFDQEGGRVIYFEGTYTAAFSAAKELTPRYDYNQILYRLRLDRISGRL